jgi:hypothetical protein
VVQALCGALLRVLSQGTLGARHRPTGGKAARRAELAPHRSLRGAGGPSGARLAGQPFLAARRFFCAKLTSHTLRACWLARAGLESPGWAGRARAHRNGVCRLKSGPSVTLLALVGGGADRMLARRAGICARLAELLELPGRAGQRGAVRALAVRGVRGGLGLVLGERAHNVAGTAGSAGRCRGTCFPLTWIPIALGGRRCQQGDARREKEEPIHGPARAQKQQ